MSTKNSRKVLSVLLAYMMVLSSFSGMAVAAEEQNGSNTAQVVNSGPEPEQTPEDTIPVPTVPDVKDVEDLLEDLPNAGEVDSDSDLEDLEDRVAEALEAYEGLSAEEQEKVDPDLVENLYELMEALSAAQIMPVAETGEITTLNDLELAFEQGGEYSLSENITINNAVDLVIEKDVTLDLNGHTITKNYAAINHYFIVIKDGGSLTLNDSTENGALIAKAPFYGYGIQLRGDNPTFIMNGGKIQTSQESVDLYTYVSNAHVEVNDGKIISTDDSAMNLRGSADVSITGGTLTSGGRTGIYISGAGENPEEKVSFDMRGGKLQHSGGMSGAIQAYKNTDISISGSAKIHSEDSYAILAQENTALQISGGTLSSESRSCTISVSDSASCEITDGTITNDETGSAIKAEDDAVVSIKGGTLESTRSSDLKKEDDAQITVTGGTFKNNVSDFVSGALITKNDDGTYTVSQLETVYVAVDGDDSQNNGSESKPFASLRKALSVVKENGKIILDKGIYTIANELDITVPNLTIQGAGKGETIIQLDESQTSGDLEAFIIVRSDNVKIKDLTITTVDADASKTIKGNALKFSNYTNDNDKPKIMGGMLENVEVISAVGSALNIHGAEDIILSNVEAKSIEAGVGISVVDAVNLQISGTTSTGKWGSLGIMYKENDKNYTTPSSIILGDGNTLEGSIYAEDETGRDTISSIEPLYKVIREGVVTWVSELPAESSGIVLIHEGEYTLCDTLEDALAAAEEGDTIEVHKDVAVTNSNAMRITQNNLTIIGVSADGEEKPTINLGNTSVSGQAGILVEADGVTLENLNIVSESENGNVSAVKFSKIPASSDAEMDLIENGNIKNVTISSENGHALNIHGVDGMNVDGLTVEKAGKLNISIANSSNVNISNSKTFEGGWNADIGIMYKDTNEYANASTVVLGNGNTFANGNVFYSERGETVDHDGDVDSVTYADDTVLYKVLGDDDNYYYVEENKIVASIDDSTENPVGYNSLDEAIDDAAAGEKIDLHQDVTNATIDKKVTINGNGNVISGDVSLKNDPSIENADLTNADITIEGSADLSGNYWGGGIPENIPGAEINTYLDKIDGDPIPLNADGVIKLLEDADYTMESAEAQTAEDVKKWLDNKVGGLLNDLEFTVIINACQFAVDGTAEEPDGTDGSFTFTVKFLYNGNPFDVTLKGAITAAEYIPEEPTDPEDPDDNDDDNSSSSGGSSGGGSFIGHPDGWVPGGIIILDGSEQIQPTGSLLLDTKTYTMAPGVVYDILATLEGASENELRVYSSQPGVASVEAIGGGKYRVTGLADGQTYIMFEVWRDGVMLNHASVKVTIADGVVAYGESNREASIF